MLSLCDYEIAQAGEWSWKLCALQNSGITQPETYRILIIVLIIVLTGRTHYPLGCPARPSRTWWPWGRWPLLQPPHPAGTSPPYTEKKKERNPEHSHVPVGFSQMMSCHGAECMMYITMCSNNSCMYCIRWLNSFAKLTRLPGQEKLFSTRVLYLHIYWNPLKCPGMALHKRVRKHDMLCNADDNKSLLNSNNKSAPFASPSKSMNHLLSNWFKIVLKRWLLAGMKGKTRCSTACTVLHSMYHAVQSSFKYVQCPQDFLMCAAALPRHYLCHSLEKLLASWYKCDGAYQLVYT